PHHETTPSNSPWPGGERKGNAQRERPPHPNPLPRGERGQVILKLLPLSAIARLPRRLSTQQVHHPRRPPLAPPGQGENRRNSLHQTGATAHRSPLKTEH